MKRALLSGIIYIALAALSSVAVAVPVSVKSTSKQEILSSPNCLTTNKIISEYIFRGSNKDCDFVRSLEQTFAGIQKHWGIELPPVRVILVDEADNASFDEGNVIQVPLRLFSMGEYGKMNYKLKMDSLAVAAHEYGHFVYNELWLKKDPSVKSTHQLLMKASDFLILNAKGKVPQSVWRQAYEDATESGDYQKTRAELLAYTELFADIVAVSYFDNKEVIFKALYFDSMKEAEFQRVYLRSFAQSSSRISEMDLFESHSRLSIVRSFIGEKLWSQLQGAPAKRSQVFHLIYESYLEETKQPHASFLQQNDELIDRLKKSFL